MSWYHFRSLVVSIFSDTFIFKTSSSFIKIDWNGYSDYLEERITLNIPFKTHNQLKKEIELFTGK